MDLNPDDRISFRIKVLLPPKGLYAYRVFLKRFRRSSNRLIGYKLKQLLQCQGISKGSGVNNSVDLLLTLLGRRRVTLRGC